MCLITKVGNCGLVTPQWRKLGHDSTKTLWRERRTSFSRPLLLSDRDSEIFQEATFHFEIEVPIHGWLSASRKLYITNQNNCRANSKHEKQITSNPDTSQIEHIPKHFPIPTAFARNSFHTCDKNHLGFFKRSKKRLRNLWKPLICLKNVKAGSGTSQLSLCK